MTNAFSKPARVRLLDALHGAEPRPSDLLRALGDAPAPLFDGTAQIFRERFGLRLEEMTPPMQDIEEVCMEADEETLVAFLWACSAHLRRIAASSSQIGQEAGMPPALFEARINEIFKAQNYPRRFDNGRVIPVVASEAEALRRLLIRDAADAASCTQGDPQVEMVASTVQKNLERPGSVLVDYGAGFGRVMSGLAHAPLFKSANYIVVDDPIAPEVRQLSSKIGIKTEFVTREKYLKQGTPADVIMVVNTLHHMPFRDVARQLSSLLGSLKQGGYLLIHDMGELREPEQLNVPWRIEHIQSLLAVPSLSVNPRSTTTRGKKVPLSHVLVSVDQPGPKLEESLVSTARRVWKTMKEQTLEEIAAIYASKDEERQKDLQYLLIANANLDLNRLD